VAHATLPYKDADGLIKYSAVVRVFVFYAAGRERGALNLLTPMATTWENDYQKLGDLEDGAAEEDGRYSMGGSDHRPFFMAPP
jgi:hypothetical protein